MKKLINLIFTTILLSSLLFSCKKKESLLLDELLGLSVNPTTSLFTDDLVDINAWLLSDSAVIGYGGIYNFYSPDLFQDEDSVFGDTGSIKNELLYYGIDELVSWTSGPNSDLTIESSNDFGESYQQSLFFPQLENRNDSCGTTGIHYISTVDFWGANSGVFSSKYFASTCTNVFFDGLKVYRIQGSDPIFLADLGVAHYPIKIQFLDQNNGFLLANLDNGQIPSTSSSMFIFTTSDGGFTWSSPIQITTTERLEELYVLNQNKLIAYNKGTNRLYISNDGGLTWQLHSLLLSNGITDIQFIDENRGYLASFQYNDEFAAVGDLLVTLDGGISWSVQNSNPLYIENINFLDQDYGLAMSKSVLQYTDNGGLTWELLIFPF